MSAPDNKSIMYNFCEQSDFVNRSTENFDNRNPPVTLFEIYRILNIHDADRPGYVGEFDLFTQYSNIGMTNAEYYLENQINIFYRIVLFFSELNAYGVLSDEDDIYEGPLPYEVIPQKIQEIIYDDDVYREYLLNERSIFELTMDETQNEIIQNLIKTTRVYEEDLIMLKLNNPSTSGEQFKMTTTERTTSSSTQNQSSKRKGSVFVNEHGKRFAKRPSSTFTDNFCGTVSKNSNTQHAGTSHQEHNNYSIENLNDEVSFDLCSKNH